MAIVRRMIPTANFGWDRDFGVLKNEMNRMFEDFFGRGFVTPSRKIFPPVNLYEDNDNIFLTAELPGMDTKDIDISVESEGIVIKGELKTETPDKECHYHRCERQTGSFSKKINLPSQIAADKVSAEMTNGILKITMPKAEKSKQRKIEVKVG